MPETREQIVARVREALEGAERALAEGVCGIIPERMAAFIADVRALLAAPTAEPVAWEVLNANGTRVSLCGEFDTAEEERKAWEMNARSAKPHRISPLYDRAAAPAGDARDGPSEEEVTVLNELLTLLAEIRTAVDEVTLVAKNRERLPPHTADYLVGWVARVMDASRRYYAIDAARSASRPTTEGEGGR